MSKKIYTVDEIRKLVFPVADQYGIERMYLFGSYARGDATPESDLDFRIDKGAIKGLIALGGFYSELADVLEKKLDLLQLYFQYTACQILIYNFMLFNSLIQ